MKIKKCIICGTGFEAYGRKILCSKECFEKRKNERVREWMQGYRQDPEVRERNRKRVNAKYLDPEYRKRIFSRSGTVRKMHSATLVRAKHRNMPFELTREIVDDLITSQNGRCAITGIPFRYDENDHYERRPFAPSIDRIDSRFGYTLDNVQVVGVAVNIAKSEYPQEIFDEICLARVHKLESNNSAKID